VSGGGTPPRRACVDRWRYARRAAVRGAIISALFSPPVVTPARAQASSPAGASDFIRVVVDPRIELAAIAFHLGDQRAGWTDRGVSSAYRKAALRQFRPHREHRAIRAAPGRAFAYSWPAMAMVQLAPPPTLTRPVRLRMNVERSAGGALALDTWLADLRHFARATDFDAWFHSQAAVHESFVAPVRDLLHSLRLGPRLEAHFGQTVSRFTVVLAPLIQRTVGFGAQVRTAEAEAFAIIGPSGRRRPSELFIDDTATFLALTLHEFTHALVEHHLPSDTTLLLEAAASLQAPAVTAARPAYTDPGVVVVEYLVRACTIAIAAAMLPSEVAQRVARSQAPRAFPRLNHVQSVLADRIAARGLAAACTVDLAEVTSRLADQ